MFSTVIDLCKSIIEYVRQEGEIKLETKLRISSILEEISQIILDTANKLEKDEYPHYNCVLLEKLSDNLHFHLIDYVKPAELDTLHSSLREVSQIEKLFSIRKESDTIPQLQKFAAEFKAIALLIKF